MDKRGFSAKCVLPVLFLSMMLVAGAVDAEIPRDNKLVVCFFRSEGCPHCEKEKAFLDLISRKYPVVRIMSFEVRSSRENAVLFAEMAASHGVIVKGVPATFIGPFEPVFGYEDDATTGRLIEDRIRYCLERGCRDPRYKGAEGLTAPQGKIGEEEDGFCAGSEECPEFGGAAGPAGSPQGMTGTKEHAPQAKTEKGVVKVPLFGDIEISGNALPWQTVLIAALDGFNPCAFFVLFTLMGLLAHVRSRKKMVLVGGIFVFFSGLVYFMFMAAWLNVFMLTGQVAAVTAIAGGVALAIALVNIKDFFFFKRGISLVIPEKAKPRLFERMRKLLKESSLPATILGAAVLAVAANAYELFCTAGFPLVYTRILTLQDVPKTVYYLYLALYNVVYVIPLALIVLFFVMTLGARKLTEWQGQRLKLVSGMMMLGLGLTLLLKPELMGSIAVTAGLLASALLLSALISFAAARAGRVKRN